MLLFDMNLYFLPAFFRRLMAGPVLGMGSSSNHTTPVIKIKFYFISHVELNVVNKIKLELRIGLSRMVH